MATVIDSLLIELGLDTSKFDQNQKKSVEQLRKMDEQAQKTGKAVQKSANDIGDGFNFAKDALIAFGSILSFNAMKNFLVDTTKTNIAIGNTSNLLGMSARELKSWGQMAELVGGNIESITSTFKNLQGNLADVKMGGGDKFLEYVSYIQQATGKDLGFDLSKGTFDIYKLSDALADLKSKVSTGQYNLFTQAIGITPDSLVLLEKGEAYLRKNEDAFNKLNAAMDANVKKAELLNDQWVKVKNTLESIKQTVYGKIVDFLLKPSSPEDKEAWDRYDAIRKEQEEKKTKTEVPSGKVSGTNKENTKKLMDYFQSVGWTKEQSAGIVGNLQQESSLNPTAKNVDKFGKSHLGIAQWDPERQTDFKTWAGFDITDPRANDLMLQAAFVNFELQKGKKIAVGNTLKQMKTTESSSDIVSQKYEIAGDTSDAKRRMYAIQAYKETSPLVQNNQTTHNNNQTENNNNQTTHNSLDIKNIPNSSYRESANMIGAQNTAPIVSGGNKNEVNTNIQSIVVNTQATDANGIYRDTGKALQQNTLINAGIVGNF